VKDTMRAARLHEPGKPMRIDAVPVPRIRPHEVLVRVEAAGVISNMNAVFSGQYWYHLPPLPAIVGLDAAGVIERVGSEVRGFAEGERVYINPLLSCGSCAHCRGGSPTNCSFSAFRGYFAFSREAVKQLEENPHGGFSEYTAAPASRLVKLPQEVSFELGARWGYLGTSFAALEAGGARGGSWVMINGVTGTLGVGAVHWALGTGAARILGLGRRRDILERVKALAPRRIEVLALGERPIADWARERTQGIGADLLLDCTGRGSVPATTLAAIEGLRPGGVAVNVSALTDPLPINPVKFMTAQLHYRGSNWVSVAQGERMAEMVRCGAVDLGVIEPRVYPLEAVNEALAEAKKRPGGFVNVVVAPWR
jgi:threonine dehydrogenase-like Zn-dependent dehydrogenase